MKKIVQSFCPRSGPGRLSAEELASLPDRLMDAALTLFNTQGYSDTTMEQIARLAGASTKTLYSRYANKAELAKAVVTRMVDRSMAAHEMDLSADPSALEPRAYLLSAARKIARTLSGEGAGMIRIALAEARRFPELADTYNGNVARGTGIFQRALEAWHAQGQLPDLGNPVLAARMCLSMLSDQTRIHTAMGQPMDPAELDELLIYAVDLFLRGCGYRPVE
jgi:AcrR family transcriptional regulator